MAQENSLYTASSEAWAISIQPQVAQLGCTFNAETNIECCGPGPRNSDGSCGGTLQQIYGGIPGMLPIDWRTGILQDGVMQANCCGCGSGNSGGGAGAGGGAAGGGGGSQTPTSGPSTIFGNWAHFPWWLLVVVLILIFAERKKA